MPHPHPLTRRRVGQQALAGGVRAMMPYVDEFRPVHSLDSLRDLATALAGRPGPEHDPKRWLRAVAQ